MSSYFEKRAEKRMKKAHDNATKVMRKLNNIYTKSIKRLDDEIVKIMDGVNKLGSEDAKKLLDEHISYNDYESLLLQYHQTNDKEVRSRLRQKIKAIASRGRIKRKEAIKEAIDNHKLYMIDKETGLVTNHLSNTISNQFKDNGFSGVSNEYINEVLKNKWSGQNYSSRIWKNQTRLAKLVEDNIIQSIISGKTNRQIVNELKELTMMGRHVSDRLIRTETSYVVNSADLEVSKRLGIKAKKFSAHLDKRTSKICREHHESIVKVEDIKIGVNAPPLHPYCRSVMVDLVKYWDYYSDEELDRLVSNEGMYADSRRKTRKREEKLYNIKPYNLELPITLENYESYKGEWYNKNIKNIFNRKEEKIITQKIKNLFDSSEYSIRFKSYNLEGLLNTGKFMNQFETKTSGGTISKKYRKKATEQLFGSDVKKLKNKDYEKYGYISSSDIIKDHKNNLYKGTWMYGDVNFRLHKSRLKNRVTYTFDDSLGPANMNGIIAATPNDKGTVGIQIPKVKDYGEKILKSNYKDINDLVNDFNIRYVEAQYHGDVTLNDVKDVIFHGLKPGEDIIRRLKKLSIKIYYVKGEEVIEV